MRYALFLGCTVPARARNYELAAIKVATILGIELVHLQDFGCCGFPLRSLNQRTTLLLAARALAISEEKGLNICCLCTACTSVLTEASEELKNTDVRDKVNADLRPIKREYKGTVTVKHFNRILYEDVGGDKIRNLIKKELSSLRIAPHYGCHYLKPSRIYDRFDDPENPKSLDHLIEVTGATSVNYQDKKQCCGGGILAVNQDLSVTIAQEKLACVTTDGADAMCLVCPFCAVMYDDNQKSIEAKFETVYQLPVLYYPQLLGLALGLDRRDLGLNMNRVKTKGLLEKVGVGITKST